MKTGTLILLRHGQSDANKQNIFAGWLDTPLNDTGKRQASDAGDTLRRQDIHIDAAYTSDLSRARETGELALKAAGCNVPLQVDTRLRERFYGALTGRNKEQALEEFGAEKFLAYRRSFAVQPPAMDASHAYHPANTQTGPKVIDVPEGGTESLADVVARVTPFYEEKILPLLREGKTVLLAAHGNSLRALSMVIEGMTPEEVEKYEIANGEPIRYVAQATESGLKLTRTPFSQQLAP